MTSEAGLEKATQLPCSSVFHGMHALGSLGFAEATLLDRRLEGQGLEQRRERRRERDAQRVFRVQVPPGSE